jgi:hypothetical protein
MKTITLKQAIDFLKTATAVNHDHTPCWHHVIDPEHPGRHEDTFLAFSDTFDGEDYLFYERDNEFPRIDGSKLYLTLREGGEIILTLLTPMVLETVDRGSIVDYDSV